MTVLRDRVSSRLLGAILAITCLAGPAAAKPLVVVPPSRIVATGARPKAAGGGQRAGNQPRLVVMLVVDQFRADNLSRYGHLFSPDGFQRLLGKAAMATGHYGQQNTYTGPGHALIATGSYGYLNGVMQNKFWNPKSGRSEAMMFDADARIIDDKENTPEDETSPKNLIGSTLGDELRMVSKDARVVSIALKGRGSILLGGHLGTAYFFSDQTGEMTSSSFYMQQLPEWVRSWNGRKPADAAFGKKWERLLPPTDYPQKDDSPYETDVKGLGKVFPHPLTGKLKAPGPAYYEALTHTPFGLDLEMDFVSAALDAEQLGKRGATDLLGISISSTDLCGHAFGPDSQEYEDMVVRLDRALGKFLSDLDRRFRPGEVLVLLTADHGAVPIPEQVAEKHLMAAARIKKATLKAAINKALSDRFGAGEWVIALEDPSVYLDQNLIQKNKADPEKIEEAAGRAALTLPGMLQFYTRTQLLHGQLPPTEAARAVARSYAPQRAGDVVLVTEPFYFWGKFGEKDQGSTHGSFYRYDTDVPVFFLGPWFTPGNHGIIEMVDVAATLSHVLRLTPPSACEGRPVMHMLRGGRGE